MSRNLKPRSTVDIRYAVICLAVAVFCLLSFRRMWYFVLIFFAMAALHFRNYCRHRARESELEDIISGVSEIDDDDGDVAKVSGINVKKTKIFLDKDEKKQRESDYDKFLEELESELGDFDEEDYS